MMRASFALCLPRALLPAGLLLLAACRDTELLAPQPPALASASVNTWTTRAPMPTARARFAAGVVDGVLYAVGGQNASGSLTTVEAYTVGKNTWIARAPLPAARSSLNVGVIQGVLYAAGGLDASGEPTGTLYAYDPGTNTWSSRSPMPVAGGCGGSGVIDGRLYVFTTDCRESQLGAGPAFQRYDPGTDSWTSLALPAWGHYLPAAGVLNGRFYLAGGLFPTTNGTGNVGQNVESYDPAADSWTTRAAAPAVVYQTAGAVVNGQLYMVGGGTGTDYLQSLFAYDSRSDRWQRLRDLPTARGFPAAATLGGRLYALGGLDLAGFLATNEAYDAGPRH